MASAKPTFILRNDAIRRRAMDQILLAPEDSIVTIGAPQRSLEQNKKLHAMITDVAVQRRHAGLTLSVTDWKRLFTAAWRNELRVVPNLTGNGIVQLGERTSELSIAEASDLIEFIFAWGAEHGVTWSEPFAVKVPPEGDGAASEGARVTAALPPHGQRRAA